MRSIELENRSKFTSNVFHFLKIHVLSKRVAFFLPSTGHDIEKDGWISPGFGWSTVQKASILNLVELAPSVYTNPRMPTRQRRPSRKPLWPYEGVSGTGAASIGSASSRQPDQAF